MNGFAFLLAARTWWAEIFFNFLKRSKYVWKRSMCSLRCLRTWILILFGLICSWCTRSLACKTNSAEFLLHTILKIVNMVSTLFQKALCPICHTLMSPSVAPDTKYSSAGSRARHRMAESWAWKVCRSWRWRTSNIEISPFFPAEMITWCCGAYRTAGLPSEWQVKAETVDTFA